jgi:hypothetical protein
LGAVQNLYRVLFCFVGYNAGHVETCDGAIRRKPAWGGSAACRVGEELTAGDFVKAMDRAQGVCVLPFGIVEKHGPQLPLGTDLINIRYSAVHGAEQEYAIVFPAYYFGQIFEAKHEPGTLAYSARLQLELLQETTD